VFAAILTIATGVGVGAVSLAASPTQPAASPIPAGAGSPRIAPSSGSLVSNFIPTVDRRGYVVGYVAKSDLYPERDGAPPAVSLGPIPVYGPDLKTVVGHMYPGGVGFVPLGSTPSGGVTTTTTVVPTRR
jgi:hypothetical protein